MNFPLTLVNILFLVIQCYINSYQRQIIIVLLSVIIINTHTALDPESWP